MPLRVVSIFGIASVFCFRAVKSLDWVLTVEVRRVRSV